MLVLGKHPSLPGATASFRLHLLPHCFAEGKLRPPNRPMNVDKAMGCMKANPSCPPHGHLLTMVCCLGLQQVGDMENLHEACPLGKLLRPSVTMPGSPVHTSSAFARPSGKHR